MKTSSGPLLKRRTKKTLETLNDEELEGMLDDDTRTVLLLIPGGVVAATVIGADLAPDAVIAALEQITEGIKQKGIPKEKVVEAKPVRVPASKPKPQK